MLGLKIAASTVDGIESDAATLEREAMALTSIAEYSDLMEPYYGSVEHDGTKIPFLLTRWIGQGNSLREVRDLATLDPHHQRQLIRTLFEALAPVHSDSWIHGDIQPAHCVSRSTGGFALIDFGLAQRYGNPLPLYKGGLVHFNAPEICKQILEDGSARPTSQSDVYSLAASIYWAITGQYLGTYTPDDDWNQIVHSIASGHLISPAFGDDQIDSHLAHTLHLALSPEPLDRPTDAAHFLRLLHRG